MQQKLTKEKSMKNLFMVLFILFTLFSCDKDEDTTEPVIEEVNNIKTENVLIRLIKKNRHIVLCLFTSCK